jgi:hypothetical protein
MPGNYGFERRTKTHRPAYAAANCNLPGRLHGSEQIAERVTLRRKLHRERRAACHAAAFSVLHSQFLLLGSTIVTVGGFGLFGALLVRLARYLPV